MCLSIKIDIRFIAVIGLSGLHRKGKKYCHEPLLRHLNFRGLEPKHYDNEKVRTLRSWAIKHSFQWFDWWKSFIIVHFLGFRSLGGKAAPTGEVPITSQEVATGRSSVNALPQGDTARSTGRRSNRDGQSQLIPSSSARESSRATARESARDTVPDLHSSLGPSVSARLASARSGAANKTATGRSSARSGLGALDSVRTDMSTGRLESTMQSLHKEKHALMRKLLAVEEELEKETKSSALVRRK